MNFNDMPKPLSLAFLGGAVNSAVGKAHSIAIELDHRFNLMAGCFSLSAEMNCTTAEQYKVAPERTYSKAEELLERERGQIDALVILTPTHDHASHVISGINAGIPVICEKALVASSAEAEEIRTILNREQGFLAVTYNYTGYPMLRELKQMIADKKLGTIRQVLVEMPQEGFIKSMPDGSAAQPQAWRLHDEKVPTVSLDLGVHLHSIVKFLTDETPISVVAQSDSYGDFSQVVDSVMCMARYTNDISCSIWFTKAALGYRNGLKVRVFGDEGSAEWVQDYPEDLWFTNGIGQRYKLDRGSPGLLIANQERYTRFKAGHPSGFIEAFANYYLDIADELRRFKEGDGQLMNPLVYGVDESIEGLKMLEAIAESSFVKSWVDVR